MTGLPKDSAEALAPVRDALRTAAETRADQLRQEAVEQAQAVVAAARDEAARIIASAVSQGEASARSDADLRSARARRQAHETVLGQQSALRRELQRHVREAATAVRREPVYAELLVVLTERCRAVLGAEATVTEDPAGGVVGRASSRSLDLSLPTLAARTLESMSPEVSRLWTR